MNRCSTSTPHYINASSSPPQQKEKTSNQKAEGEQLKAFWWLCHGFSKTPPLYSNLDWDKMYYSASVQSSGSRKSGFSSSVKDGWWVYVSCQTHPFSTSMIFARKSSFKDFWFLRSCQFPMISPKREELKVWSVAVAGWYLPWLLVLASPSASKPMGWPRTRRRRLDDLAMSLFAKHLRMLDPNWPKNILERMENWFIIYRGKLKEVARITAPFTTWNIFKGQGTTLISMDWLATSWQHDLFHGKYSGQIAIIPKPELKLFWEDSSTKLHLLGRWLGYLLAEICLNMFLHVFLKGASQLHPCNDT